MVYAIAARYLLPALTHETRAAERKQILDGFRQGRYRALVTSRVLNEGVDVPEAKVAIVLGGGASAREYIQRLGRVLRKVENQEAVLFVPYGSVSSIRAQVRAMARLVEAGTIRAVGVSNFSARQMAIAHEELAKHGLPLASNQVQINLLHRKIETNGVLQTARQLGVTLITYVPLRSGMLTGKFHADRSLIAKLPRMRRMMTGLSTKNLDRTAPLIDELRTIADAHQATVTQVALAWLITYYGDTVVATPGASKPHHAAEAAGAMKIALSNEETERLAALSARVTR